jgi:hypothetical protein
VRERTESSALLPFPIILRLSLYHEKLYFMPNT